MPAIRTQTSQGLDAARLAAAVAASAASADTIRAAIVAWEGSKPAPVADLIRAHKAAWKRLGDACDLTDEVRARAEYRTIKQADYDEWRAANEAEKAALEALARHVATDPAEQRKQARYLRAHVDAQGIAGPVVRDGLARVMLSAKAA